MGLRTTRNRSRCSLDKLYDETVALALALSLLFIAGTVTWQLLT